MPVAKLALSRRRSQRVNESQTVSASTELFCLCQTATPDGALSKDESRRLAEWLDATRERDVPARAYVEELVRHILAAGRVSPADLQALARVLEPALPRELRRTSAALRVVGAEGLAPAEDTGTDRMRNEVLASACFVVVGARRARIERIAAGAPVLLTRRAGTRTPDAIEVCAANGKVWGQVPEPRARVLAPLLDRGARYRAHVVSASRGAHSPVLIVQAFLYRSDAALGFGATAGRKMRQPRAARRAWLMVRIGIALLIAAGVALVLRT
jgi:hypothetical protein